MSASGHHVRPRPKGSTADQMQPQGLVAEAHVPHDTHASASSPPTPEKEGSRSCQSSACTCALLSSSIWGHAHGLGTLTPLACMVSIDCQHVAGRSSPSSCSSHSLPCMPVVQVRLGHVHVPICCCSAARMRMPCLCSPLTLVGMIRGLEGDPSTDDRAAVEAAAGTPIFAARAPVAGGAEAERPGFTWEARPCVEDEGAPEPGVKDTTLLAAGCAGAAAAVPLPLLLVLLLRDAEDAEGEGAAEGVLPAASAAFMRVARDRVDLHQASATHTAWGHGTGGGVGRGCTCARVMLLTSRLLKLVLPFKHPQLRTVPAAPHSPCTRPITGMACVMEPSTSTMACSQPVSWLVSLARRAWCTDEACPDAGQAATTGFITCRYGALDRAAAGAAHNPMGHVTHLHDPRRARLAQVRPHQVHRRLALCLLLLAHGDVHLWSCERKQAS